MIDNDYLDMSDKIADLEEKLAESEEAIKNIQQVSDKYYGLYKEKFNRVLELAKENNELKQQLAEKEKAIEEINKEFVGAIHDWKQLVAEKEKEIKSLKASSDKNIDYLIEFASLIENEKDCNKMLKALDRVKKGKKYIVDKAKQDKISFAVEQLTLFKNTFLNRTNNLYIVNMEDIWADLDNQIKQLKEQE